MNRREEKVERETKLKDELFKTHHFVSIFTLFWMRIIAAIANKYNRPLKADDIPHPPSSSCVRPLISSSYFPNTFLTCIHTHTHTRVKKSLLHFDMSCLCVFVTTV